ncbi:MAG: hypothetical protein JEZ04_12855 [Spirochaetales bacterium]|nr:hypothetical protein [Spirochaetales bacterium]
MTKFIFRISILAAAAAILSACATTSGVPEWVSTSPEDTSEYKYFIGIGSDSDGDINRAADEAADLIVSEIIRYVGVRITSDTRVESKDAYSKFESSLRLAIREQPGASLGGLRVADRWIDYGDPAVVVHMLVEYSAAEIKAEKKKLEDLFREKVEALSGPEKEGDELYMQKKYYRSAVSFIDAALMVSVSDIENVGLKFERNIAKAEDAVEQIEIEAVSGPDFAYIGEKFDGKFTVKLSYSGLPAVGLPVTVSYKELRANGRKAVRTHTILTDGDGLASFDSPIPEWIGLDKITFFLDMRAVIEPLEDVNFDLLQYVDSLEQAVNSKKVFFEYEVFSKAVEVPTCVMVMDVDRSGNPLDKTDTASGIVSVLTEAGFEIFMIPVDYRMTAVSDSELIKIVREQYGNLYQRMVFGTAEISSYEETGGNVIVKVTGKIKAVELESGRILFSASEQKRARGGSNSSTIAAAFTSLGKMYGDKLTTDLP